MKHNFESLKDNIIYHLNFFDLHNPFANSNNSTWRTHILLCYYLPDALQQLPGNGTFDEVIDKLLDNELVPIIRNQTTRRITDYFTIDYSKACEIITSEFQRIKLDVNLLQITKDWSSYRDRLKALTINEHNLDLNF